MVTLRAEGVDRNLIARRNTHALSVTLRAEGVDRNNAIAMDARRLMVTLRAEGVDRNALAAGFGFEIGGHPPCGGCG